MADAVESRKRIALPTQDDQVSAAPVPHSSTDCQAMIVIMIVEESAHTRWFTVRRRQAGDLGMAERFDRLYKHVSKVWLGDADKTHYQDTVHLSWASDQARDRHTTEQLAAQYHQALERFEREKLDGYSNLSVFTETANIDCAIGGSITPVDHVVYCDDYA